MAALTEARIEVRREPHKPEQGDRRMEFRWPAANLRFYIPHVDNATRKAVEGVLGNTLEGWKPKMTPWVNQKLALFEASQLTC